MQKLQLQQYFDKATEILKEGLAIKLFGAEVLSLLHFENKMNKPKPIKRHKSIQPLSRDHHHSLLLCWKLRKGFSKGVAPERMKKYSDWFFQDHVLPHFEIEEKYLFTLLDSENEMVKKALADHRRLQRLFENDKDLAKSLSLIEEELEHHVRFEERELFNAIQKKATEEELAVITFKHKDEKFKENTEDEFWK